MVTRPSVIQEFKQDHPESIFLDELRQLYASYEDETLELIWLDDLLIVEDGTIFTCKEYGRLDPNSLHFMKKLMVYLKRCTICRSTSVLSNLLIQRRYISYS
jgi:hypothetical protein